MTTSLPRLWRRALSPVDARPLAIFRAVLGAALLGQMLVELSPERVHALYVAPRLHFSYPGLDFLEPLPGAGMQLLVYGLAAAAAALTVGLFSRLAALAFAVGWTYLLLVDKAFYKNHDYLIALLALLLVVVPLLLSRRLRLLGIAAAIAFHLTNASFLPIGVFPWLMIGALVLFVDPDEVARRLPGIPRPRPAAHVEAPRGRLAPRAFAAFFVVHALVQVLVSLVPYAYPHRPEWSDEGRYFAWRMLLRRTETTLSLRAVVDGRSVDVDTAPLVAENQRLFVSRSPEALRQLAHKLAQQLSPSGERVEVYARVMTSMNGRPPRLVVDPEVDLAAEAWSPWPARFILPLEAP